jgi:hypothetical protein
MAQAITGDPAIYLFSNLDTVNPALADRAKSAISAIIDPASKADKARKACAAMASFLIDLNQEAMAQIKRPDRGVAMLRPVRPAPDKSEEAAPTIEPQDAARVWNYILPNSGTEIVQPAAPKGSRAGSGVGWSVVAEINPRTMKWLHLDAGQRLSYFPSDGPLDPRIIQSLQTGPFPVLFFDGQNAILLVDCSEANVYLKDNP